MQSSFQSTTYNHSLQTQILGPSGLKIFAGEDLSNFHLTKPAETGNDSNKSSRKCGGNNKKRKNKEKHSSRNHRRNLLTNKLCKSMNIEDSSKKKSRSA